MTIFFIWGLDRIIFRRDDDDEKKTVQSSVSSSKKCDEEIPVKPKIQSVILTKKQLLEEFGRFDGNNLYTRHDQKTAVELDNFDRETELNKKRIMLKAGRRFRCYGCGENHSKTHPVYLFSCFKCGDKFQSYRHYTRDMTGRVALVTGCRVKLGHQVCLKLLRAGAHVIGTSRYPDQVMSLFEKYHDFEEWKGRFEVYPVAIDYEGDTIMAKINRLVSHIEDAHGHLDILVNVAGRTLLSSELSDNEMNRYGEGGYLKTNDGNSWQQTFDKIQQNEYEMYYRTNTVGTAMMIHGMLPLLERSKVMPYVINIHSRFGLMTIGKDPRHMHLSMAKAGLAMMTKSLTRSGLRTLDNVPFSIHGVDPGWYSMDDFTEEDSPMPMAPLDEVDAAARVLFPIFRGLKNLPMTQRHFNQYVY